MAVKVLKEEVGSYLIGSDVEFFLKRKDSEEIVSAEGLIQGTKKEPFKFDKDEPFFATSLDNVMAEGNIPPARTPAEFYAYVEKLRNYIDATIPQDLMTVAIPSARLGFEHLMTENSQVFGCDPSLNCWTGEQVIPQPSGDNLRSAGFHIHVGYEGPNADTNRKIAKAMDLFLGVPSILMEPENERKVVGYGCAGNYRDQKHGMEYRSLSSHFSSEERLVKWCFESTEKAIAFVNDNKIESIDELGDTLQNIINTEDKEQAAKIVADFNLQLA
jgi:protein-arginine kinase activator protein McsA